MGGVRVHYPPSEPAEYPVEGKYVGNGVEAGQNVNLGFSPSLICVYPNNIMDAFLSTEGGCSATRAKAFNMAGTEILKCTETGFFVTKSGNYSPKLNDAGRTYFYLAFP